MATKIASGSGHQVWLPPDLARGLRLYAERERRSISAAIRLAVEDCLRAQARRS